MALARYLQKGLDTYKLGMPIGNIMARMAPLHLPELGPHGGDIVPHTDVEHGAKPTGKTRTDC